MTLNDISNTIVQISFIPFTKLLDSSTGNFEQTARMHRYRSNQAINSIIRSHYDATDAHLDDKRDLVDR